MVVDYFCSYYLLVILVVVVVVRVAVVVVVVLGFTLADSVASQFMINITINSFLMDVQSVSLFG